MGITFQSEEVDFPPKIVKTRNWIKEVAKSYGKSIGEINYLFCNDEKILELNNRYLSHDFYTDIITFDYSEGGIISGDIVISLETVRSNSERYETPFEEELHRVIIHGILHLCGIKDTSPDEAKEMRAAENQALSLIADFK